MCILHYINLNCLCVFPLNQWLLPHNYIGDKVKVPINYCHKKILAICKCTY